MSKKRIRKNGKPAVYRPRVKSYGIHTKTVDEMKQLFENLEASVQMRLPIGLASIDDICIIRDFINLTEIAYITRGDRTDDEMKEAIPFLEDCGQTLIRIADRYKKIKKVVCTGDELTLIHDAVADIGVFLQDSIEHTPQTLVFEWALMDKYNRQSYDKEQPIECVTLSIERIRKDLEKIKASHSFIRPSYSLALGV